MQLISRMMNPDGSKLCSTDVKAQKARFSRWFSRRFKVRLSGIDAFGQLAPNISTQHQYLTTRDRDAAVEYFPADLSAQVFWNVYNWFQGPPPYSRSPRWATSRATSPTLMLTVSNQICCCQFIEVPSNSSRRAADTVFPSYSPKLHNILPVCISRGSTLKLVMQGEFLFLYQSLWVS